MIKLQDLKLSDILPERLKTADILALAYALDGELQEITKAIDEVIIMPRISEQPEDVIDSLAWQLHVDFYEPLGLDLDRKRSLVENSLMWHRHKGTKYALEGVIRILFFEDFAIEEWFEYGGEPYFFRLIANGTLGTYERQRELFRAIHELKNERSWLEYVMFKYQVDPTAVVVAGILKHAVKHISHPGERSITQRHRPDDMPIVPTGHTQHAVWHIAAPEKREVARKHATDKPPVVPTGIVMHAVQHTSTPVKNAVAESLMFLEVEGFGIIPGYVDVDGVVGQGFVEIITEGD